MANPLRPSSQQPTENGTTSSEALPVMPRDPVALAQERQRQLAEQLGGAEPSRESGTDLAPVSGGAQGTSLTPLQEAMQENRQTAVEGEIVPAGTQESESDGGFLSGAYKGALGSFEQAGGALLKWLGSEDAADSLLQKGGETTQSAFQDSTTGALVGTIGSFFVQGGATKLTKLPKAIRYGTEVVFPALSQAGATYNDVLERTGSEDQAKAAMQRTSVFDTAANVLFRYGGGKAAKRALKNKGRTAKALGVTGAGAAVGAGLPDVENQLQGLFDPEAKRDITWQERLINAGMGSFGSVMGARSATQADKARREQERVSERIQQEENAVEGESERVEDEPEDASPTDGVAEQATASAVADRLRESGDVPSEEMEGLGYQDLYESDPIALSQSNSRVAAAIKKANQAVKKAGLPSTLAKRMTLANGKRKGGGTTLDIIQDGDAPNHLEALRTIRNQYEELLGSPELKGEDAKGVKADLRTAFENVVQAVDDLQSTSRSRGDAILNPREAKAPQEEALQAERVETADTDEAAIRELEQEQLAELQEDARVNDMLNERVDEAQRQTEADLIEQRLQEQQRAGAEASEERRKATEHAATETPLFSRRSGAASTRADETLQRGVEGQGGEPKHPAASPQARLFHSMKRIIEGAGRKGRSPSKRNASEAEAFLRRWAPTGSGEGFLGDSTRQEVQEASQLWARGGNTEPLRDTLQGIVDRFDDQRSAIALGKEGYDQLEHNAAMAQWMLDYRLPHMSGPAPKELDSPAVKPLEDIDADPDQPTLITYRDKDLGVFRVGEVRGDRKAATLTVDTGDGTKKVSRSNVRSGSTPKERTEDERFQESQKRVDANMESASRTIREALATGEDIDLTTLMAGVIDQLPKKMQGIFRSLTNRLLDGEAPAVRLSRAGRRALWGSYNQRENVITLKDPAVADSDMPYARVLAHEVTHALLNRTVDDYYAGRISEESQAYADMKALEEVYDQTRKSFNKSSIYGLKDLKEFVSEMMGNPAFQILVGKKIATGQPQGKKSLLDKFSEQTKALLGERKSSTAAWKSVVNIIDRLARGPQKAEGETADIEDPFTEPSRAKGKSEERVRTRGDDTTEGDIGDGLFADVEAEGTEAPGLPEDGPMSRPGTYLLAHSDREGLHGQADVYADGTVRINSSETGEVEVPTVADAQQVLNRNRLSLRGRVETDDGTEVKQSTHYDRMVRDPNSSLHLLHKWFGDGKTLHEAAGLSNALDQQKSFERWFNATAAVGSRVIGGASFGLRKNTRSLEVFDKAYGEDLASKYEHQSNQARAESSVGGLAHRTKHYIKDTLRQYNVSEDVFHDYKYAVGAIRLARTVDENSVTIRRNPSKFEWTDSDGVKHTGVDGAYAYLRSLSSRERAAVKEADKVFKDGLRSVYRAQYNSNLITEEQLKYRMQHDLDYVSMREPGSTGRSASGQTLSPQGRRTRATDVVNQTIAYMAEEMSHAANVGFRNQLAETIARNPDLSFAALGEKVTIPESGGRVTPTERSAATGTAEGRDKIYAYNADGTAQEILFNPENVHAKRLGALLAKTNSDAAHQAAMNYLSVGTQMFSTLFTSLNVTFWPLVTGIWSLGLSAGQVQTAFRGLGFMEANKINAALYKHIPTAIREASKESLDTPSEDVFYSVFSRLGGGFSRGAESGADEAFNALERRRRGGVTSDSMLSRATGAVAETAAKTGKVVASPTNVINQMIPFSAFKAYVNHMSGGRTFESAKELEGYLKSNPEIMREALNGARRMQPNYWMTGNWRAPRSFMPFFNSAIQGADIGIKRNGNAQGLIANSLWVLAGMATMGAFSDDGEDRRAFRDHFFSTRGTDTVPVTIGGTDYAVPVDYSVQPLVVIGKAVYGVKEGLISREEAVDRVMQSLTNSLTPFLAGGSEDSNESTIYQMSGALGAFLPFMLDRNQYGQEIDPEGGTRNALGMRADETPKYLNAKAGTGEAFRDAAVFLHNTVGIDVSPNALSESANTLLGGASRYFDPDSGTFTSPVDVATDRFRTGHNPFAERDNFDDVVREAKGEAEMSRRQQGTSNLLSGGRDSRIDSIAKQIRKRARNLRVRGLDYSGIRERIQAAQKDGRDGDVDYFNSLLDEYDRQKDMIYTEGVDRINQERRE